MKKKGGFTDKPLTFLAETFEPQASIEASSSSSPQQVVIGRLAPQQPTSQTPPTEVSTPRRTIQLHAHVQPLMDVDPRADWKPLLLGVTVLVIDDVGPLSALLRTTPSTQGFLTRPNYWLDIAAR